MPIKLKCLLSKTVRTSYALFFNIWNQFPSSVVANTFALDAEGTGSTQSARHRGMSSKNDSEVLKVVYRNYFWLTEQKIRTAMVIPDKSWCFLLQSRQYRAEQHSLDMIIVCNYPSINGRGKWKKQNVVFATTSGLYSPSKDWTKRNFQMNIICV